MYQDFPSGNLAHMHRQRITMQQAKEIALQRVPGQVMHVDMDLENGVLVYEVFIMTPQGIIYEVEILAIAKNGKILKIDQENDND